MQLRALSFAVLAIGFLTSCTGTEDTPTPGGPSSTTPSSPSNPSSPAAPAANRPPGPIKLDFQPKTPLLAGATAVSLSASVTDPDGDALTYVWDTRDDTITAGGGISYTFMRGGSQRVKVTASDGKGGSSTAEMTLEIRTLEGEWNLSNPVHQALVASISHNGRSYSGRFNNGATFSGRVDDGGRITMNLETPDNYCLAGGNYVGTLDSNLDAMVFNGAGCKGFSLYRR
jgi:hypothetical protein